MHHSLNWLYLVMIITIIVDRMYKTIYFWMSQVATMCNLLKTKIKIIILITIIIIINYIVCYKFYYYYYFYCYCYYHYDIQNFLNDWNCNYV